MNNIKVSILVPVYNTSEYLRKCLDTLVGQTLKEIEIICVNDGSTDNSLEILEQYAARDARVVIVNKPNGGLPSARNAGIDNAKGEYIGFVDSDDYVELNMFERLYNTAKKKNSEVVVCGAHIFPDKPKASDWFYDVLSPRTYNYKKFTPELLFKEKGARPFLWRNLVKRDLIVRENIRLREDIVLGEDQAFQFRVFPKARGISFISDKLYHYCWYRPGSIMAGAAQGKKISAKFNKHMNLCLHVMDEVMKLPDYEQMKKQTLFWSVDLLYEDFIKLSERERRSAARTMTEKWEQFGYRPLYKTFEPYVNDMFDYFYLNARSASEEDVDVSIIVNLYSCAEYMNDFKASVLADKAIKSEVIFLNNGSDAPTYMHLHKWLTSDTRVRVVNQPYETRANTYNLGLSLASGRAVVFADAHDIFEKGALSSYYEKIKAGADVAINGNCIAGGNMKEAPLPSLYGMMLDRKFLIDSEILFGEYNSLTTRAFALKALLSAKNADTVCADLVRERANWHRDWLYKEEARDLLEGYLELLSLTAQSGMAKAHLSLVDELNGKKTVETIINASRPYTTAVADNPNGENSQSNIFSLICKINKAIDKNMIGGNAGAYKLLAAFAQRKNSFLTYELKL